MKNLVELYEKNLEAVKAMWGDPTAVRGPEYIEFAEKELEAVKNGREW